MAADLVGSYKGKWCPDVVGVDGRPVLGRSEDSLAVEGQKERGLVHSYWDSSEEAGGCAEVAFHLGQVPNSQE